MEENCFPAQPWRTLIVDGEPYQQEFFHAICESSGFCEIVAKVGKHYDALREMVFRHPLDLLLLDIRVADGDGLDVLERVNFIKHRPRRVIIISSELTERTIFRIRHLHVNAFINKRDPVCLEWVLNEVAHGRRYFPQAYYDLSRAMLADPLCFTRLLSPHMQRIMNLVACDLDDETIGAHFKISPRTVEDHRSTVAAAFKIPPSRLKPYLREKGFGF